MPIVIATSTRWLSILASLSIVLSLAAFKLAGTDRVVTGRVLDDGRPVGGAKVFIQTCRLQGAEVKLQKAVSRADGSFKFRVANWHDECQIYAWLPGKQAGAFAIKPDEPLYGGSLQDVPVIVRVRPVARVNVKVVDSKGKPVAGIWVGPTAIGAGHNYIMPAAAVLRVLGAVTDTDGRAKIDSLPCVSYSYLGVDDSRFALVMKAAKTPESSELKIVVQPSCHLEGCVTMTGNPVRGLLLRWHARDLAVGDWAVTDSRGMFQISRAPKGPITVASATTGRIEDDHILPKTSTVAAPGNVGHLDIKLEKGTLVRFKVCDTSGKPAVEASIFGALSNPPTGQGNVATAEVLGSWRTQPTDQDGTTRIRLKPENYSVHASRYGTGFASSESVLVGDGPAQDVVLKTPPADKLDTLSVKVIDAEGYPVRTQVWVSFENPIRRKQAIIPISTGQDGVTLRGVHMPNWRRLQMRAQCGNEFSDLVVPPKSGLVVLKLHHVKLGSVQGVVTDASGHPVEGAVLQLDPDLTVPAATNTDICPHEFKTGHDGRFTFNGLYPGLETFFVVHAPGFADSQTATFTVVAGKTVRLPEVVLNK